MGDYVRLACKIANDDINTRTYNQIMSGLRDLGNEYKVDVAIKEGIVDRNFYDHPEECRYMLWSYEEYLADKLGMDATVDEKERRAIWKLRASTSSYQVKPRGKERPIRN